MSSARARHFKRQTPAGHGNLSGSALGRLRASAALPSRATRACTHRLRSMGNGQGCDETATLNARVVIVYALMPPIIAQSTHQVKTLNEDALDARNSGTGSLISENSVVLMTRAFSCRGCWSRWVRRGRRPRGGSWDSPSGPFPATEPCVTRIKCCRGRFFPLMGY